MKADNIRIHLIIITFIFFESWIAAIDIRNQDLNNLNKTKTDDYETTLLLDDDDDDDDDETNSTVNPIKHNTKLFNAGVVKRTDTELICRKTFEYDGQTLSHCYDDSHCKLYGDCCRDSKFYAELDQTVAVSGSAYNNTRYGCHHMDGTNAGRALMIGRCPRDATVHHEIRDKCERRADDFVSAYPVQSTGDGHAYKNVWCAWCNGERRRVIYWKPLFHCSGNNGRTTVSVRLENASDHTLLYRNGQWYYADYANRTLLTCGFRIQRPAADDDDATPDTPPLRPCVSEGSTKIVDGCPDGTPAAAARACASHTYTVFEYRPAGGQDMRVFRNADCARCNGLTTGHLMCEPPPPPLKSPFGFGSLFAVRAAGKRRDPCAPDEIYDVPAAKCRNVIRDELPGSCMTYVTFGRSEYDDRTMDNETAYVYVYKKRVRYVTEVRPTVAAPGAASLLWVCTDDVEGLLRPYEQSTYAVYLSYAGVAGSCVSVAALVAHLALFGCGGCCGGGAAEPKNLPEKNLASLSTGLLVGYAGYLSVALRAVTPGDGLPCLASALTTQFGFLAAFAWMFVMSADVWIVLHASTKKLRVAGGQRRGRFAVYSLFAWLAPAALTGLSAVMQLQPRFAGPLFPELRPNFHYDCWFRNPQSLVALFVLPAGTAIAANYVSFFGAVRLIATSDSGFKADDSATCTVNRTRRNLRIYVRLSLMMGLAWVFALIGAVTDTDVAWTLNTALNSLHGAFVFVAFDCNRNTVQKLAAFRKRPTAVSETQTTSANTPLSAST
ncbi:uncharacterized protein LOC126551363 [Aphis gossypii]|uniref:uncharacterized protein LOC126551363 n=1 Tax=Aphis gossypii TaxID=80765 RepID=UPI002159A2A2|nr:uncharacterized protein LOC126551363 [Aphis gossypii]